jgi:glycosyltransferase involved in cell wall biosynthesis
VRLLFVTPPLAGPATGGTLYNRQLTAALLQDGVALRHSDMPHALAALGRITPDLVWVDSLYLSDVPELCRRIGPRARVGLLLHYLPSLLQRPDPESLLDLSPSEQLALQGADCVMVPSPTMGELVRRLAPGPQLICVEPGIDTAALAQRRPRERSTCVMVCNVTENKGVYPFLAELARCVQQADEFRLVIAGRLDVEPAYARRCVALVAEQPALAPHIGFLDGVAQPQVFEWLARSALLVSASRMESYGMALAEARAHGTPILARAGGHVAAHIDPEAGGQLVEDEGELARALVALMRRPDELERRLQLAEGKRRARSWRSAALEFRAACHALMR